MKLTDEQAEIVAEIQKDECKFLKVRAIAGAGKTSTLVEMAKAVNPRNGIYLAFNKSVAVEAERKFPGSINCMTTHAFAYQNTIRPLKLKLGWFNWKNIKTRMAYINKLFVIDTMNDFFSSEFIKFDKFKKWHKQAVMDMDTINTGIYIQAEKSIKEMFSGKTEITHGGYLKLYHMMLAANKITHKEFDIIMIDEAQDLSSVTLEIFRLLPAKKKVMVGDPYQSIFSFNKCVNGFEILKDEGVSKGMTKTFRCSKEIAAQVEAFMQRHSDENFHFEGTDSDDKEIKTVMHISRTNSALVGKIIELMRAGVRFGMARKASIVFELVLILISLKPGGKIFSSEWRHLQEDVNEWDQDMLLSSEYKTPLRYIEELYGDEPGMKSALGVIGTYGFDNIIKAFDFAKENEGIKNHKILIGTTHSLKGAEADRVHILDDINNSISELMEENKPLDEYTDDEKEAINIVYVAYTRASKELINARWLEPVDCNTEE